MMHNRKFQPQRFLIFWFLYMGFYCILYGNLADSLISKETFEITNENINRRAWCTVPDSRFLYSLPALGVDRKRLYMHKKGAFFWGVGPAH